MSWTGHEEWYEPFVDFFQSLVDGGRIWREKGDDPRWVQAQRQLSVAYHGGLAQIAAFNPFRGK